MSNELAELRDRVPKAFKEVTSFLEKLNEFSSPTSESGTELSRGELMQLREISIEIEDAVLSLRRAVDFLLITCPKVGC